MIKRLSRYWQELFGRGALPSGAAAEAELVQSLGVRPYTPSNIITTIGTVIYHKRGGFYGIVTDSGTEYLPYNFRDFGHGHQPGLRIRFTAELHPKIASFYQWGTTVRLISLSKAVS